MLDPLTIDEGFMLERVQNAYHADNLLGSYLMTPVKAYGKYFITRAQASEECWKKTAWVVAHVVSGIVLYPVLGSVAALGVLVNCFLVPGGPESYSVVSLITFVPLKIDKMCQKISLKIKHFNLEAEMVEKGGMKSFSGGDSHTISGGDYKKNQWMGFFMNGKIGEDAKAILLNQIKQFGIQHGVALQHYAMECMSHPQLGTGMCLKFQIPDYVQINDALLQPALQLNMAQHHVRLLEAPQI